MSELIEVASGLRFPEGPIAMPDGSVILVEMFGPRLTRVQPDGTKETIAELAGGPNGAAYGPGDAVYVCNNGGRFTGTEVEGLLFPGPVTMANYLGGRIQRVDLSSGEVTDLYTECDGRPLWAPNDIVFDEHAGFYFSDHGLTDDEERIAHVTGIYYAKADGSEIREVVFPAHEPNGIGLSPDGTKLYWAETWTGRIMQRDITGPVRSPRPAWWTRRSASTACRASSCSTPSPSTERATSAWPRWSTAASRWCRRRASSSSSWRPTTSSPRTSASAATACGRPTSRCRAPAGS